MQLWLLPRDEDRLRRCCQDGVGLLSEAERERVERAASPVLARRFLLGRVLMRRALGAHLDADPLRRAADTIGASIPVAVSNRDT